MADAKYGNHDCAMYRDMFELLARPDIDAVLIATGDHWHALASILAPRPARTSTARSPAGITIGLCQAVDDTIRRYGRVFQAGTQRRTVSNFQAAVQLAHSGKLGKLHTLHASCYKPQRPLRLAAGRARAAQGRGRLGPLAGAGALAAVQPVPTSNGGWRGYFDFDSGATLLDWGAHTVDLCQWANQADDTMPVEYEPSASCLTARYANGVRLVMDFLPTPSATGSRYRTSLGTCPVRFEGDEGWVETGDSGRDRSLVRRRSAAS